MFPFRPGYKASGDASLLKQLGVKFGLKVEIMALRGTIEPGLVGPSSSTKVRECLDRGRVKRIISYLDRPYSLLVPTEELQPLQPMSATTREQLQQCSPPLLDESRSSCDDASSTSTGTGLDLPLEKAISGSVFYFDAATCLNQAPGDGRYVVDVLQVCSAQIESQIETRLGSHVVLNVQGSACSLTFDTAVCIEGEVIRLELLDNVAI